MKKLLLFMVVSLMAAHAVGQTDVWYWKNGTAVKAERIDSITFAEPVQTEEPAQGETDANSKEGLVITEIYFGSYPQKADGGTSYENYIYDQYFKIGNNSDHTIYLDGVAILESKMNSDEEWTIFEPEVDITNNFIAQGIYVIPGSGKEHPLEPGKEVVLALNAKNHKNSTVSGIEGNEYWQHQRDSLLIDLSQADFEFYDVSQEEGGTVDEDNENVPNLDKWYCETYTIYVVNQKAILSYALAVPEKEKETFLEENHYKFNYGYVPFWSDDPLMTNDNEAYIVPNEWIVDAVYGGYQDGTAWHFLNDSLDSGFTYIGKMSVSTRRGFAVVRKAENGKWVDTNNSTNDFTPKAAPTLR